MCDGVHPYGKESKKARETAHCPSGGEVMWMENQLDVAVPSHTFHALKALPELPHGHIVDDGPSLGVDDISPLLAWNQCTNKSVTASCPSNTFGCVTPTMTLEYLYQTILQDTKMILMP